MATRPTRGEGIVAGEKSGPAQALHDGDVRDTRLVERLFDRIPAMVAYWDRNACNVIANAAYVEWFGLTPEGMRGRHISEILGPDVYSKSQTYIEAVLRGEPQQFERTLVDVEGRTRYTQASYIPDVVDGQVLGFFALVSEVTAFVEARRALADAQEIAELGSWAWNSESGQSEWSDEMYRLAGVDRDHFAPGPNAYADLVHPEDRHILDGALKAVADGADGYDITYRIVRPSGEVRYVHGRARAERGKDPGKYWLRGTSQDVTDAHHAQTEIAGTYARLDRSLRLQADLISMLGHDVRQPLTLLGMLLENLIADWDVETKEYKLDGLHRALQACFDVNQLCDDILSMAHIDSDNFVARPEPTPVKQVIERAVMSLPRAADISLHIVGDPIAQVDGWQLRQMITNLITNALKYGEPPIAISATGSGGAVVVEVVDHGHGVQSEVLPRLFERFARGEHAAIRGAGFGLHIVQRLATANGGRVEYRPNKPHGSVFALRLAVPRSDKRASDGA